MDSKYVCMLTMLSPSVERKYESQVASQRLYSKVHGHTYIVHHVNDSVRLQPNVNYRKPHVIHRYTSSSHCRWICWFDADVHIMNRNRSLAEWLNIPGADVILTDHHQIPNNGAIFMRNTPRVVRKLLPLWFRLVKNRSWALNDNGALMEALALMYVLQYKAHSCPPRPQALLAPCFMKHFDRAFGPVRATGHRGTGGLVLVAPRDGFNNHGCLTPLVECTSPAAKGLMASRFNRGWSPDDVFVLPRTRRQQGLPPMFGLHSKSSIRDLTSTQLRPQVHAPSCATGENQHLHLSCGAGASGR